jgi:hypothetical protein
VTAFGVGACPRTQFRFAVTGNFPASAGKTVRKLAADGFTTVTFSDTPVTSEGIPAQLPFVPLTCTENVSPDPTGVNRDPTPSGTERVSTNRHGVIGTNDDRVPLDADAVTNTPDTDTATTAITDDHRRPPQPRTNPIADPPTQRYHRPI